MVGKNWSYRSWVLLLLGLAGLAATLLYGLYRDAKGRAIGELNAHQEIHARQAAKGIRVLFDHYITQLTFLAGCPDIRRLDGRGRGRMADFLRLNARDVIALSRVDARGRILHTVPFRRDVIGADISAQAQFQIARRTGRPAVSDVTTLVQGYRAVILHVPVFDGRRFDGVVGIAIPFEKITRRFLDEIRVGETGYAWMISREGIELACPVPGHVGKHVSETCRDFPDLLAITAAMMAGRSGTAVYHFDRVGEQVRERVRKHAVYLPVPLENTFWSIIVATPEDEVLAGMAGFTNRLGLLTLFLLVATALFSYAGFKAWGIVREEQRRQAVERRLEERERQYRGIFENAQEGILRTTPDGRILLANPALARMFGYGSPEEVVTAVTDIARQAYQDPGERAALVARLEAEGLLRGYETRMVRRDGSPFWVSLTITAVRDAEGRTLYYDGIVEEISERKESADRMRRALGATVQAIAATVERRDPYTAGHQQRVADLAQAMGAEMGLPPERVEGLRLAAIIHDLGKISVPAEILSKPTRLSPIEFTLIQTHAQSGYEILQDIAFPWPIARMVREHHERIDGSGYPRGLAGGALLLESRILAVADVVESMASHRPYRPAFGLEAALAEITAKRGTLYDAEAVDACLRLFREKGYRMPG